MISAPLLLRLDNGLILRGGKPIFSDLSLSLSRGQIIRIYGANGTGKSTLLRACAGLKKMEKGTLYHSAPVNFLGQHNGLKPALTLYENLSFPPAADKKIHHILSELDLLTLANRPVSSLSSGQKRRSAFAKILLHPSPLWLLDEPETGLDDISVKRLEAFIQSHAAQGGGVLLATHAKKEMPAPNEKILFLQGVESE